MDPANWPLEVIKVESKSLVGTASNPYLGRTQEHEEFSEP
jgi:hypothetical protein